MRVLCLCANLELALLRSAVLSLHGVQVDIARSRKEAEQMLEQNTYDAALLCHSISDKTAIRLTAIFRERNPERCLIFVSRSPWQPCPVKCDASVSSLDGPEALVEIVLSCKQASTRLEPRA